MESGWLQLLHSPPRYYSLPPSTASTQTPRLTEPFTTYLAVIDTSTAFALKTNTQTSHYTSSQFLQTKSLTGVSLGPVTNDCVTLRKCLSLSGRISEVSGFELQDLPFEIMRLGYVFVHLPSQRETGRCLMPKAREGLAGEE